MKTRLRVLLMQVLALCLLGTPLVAQDLAATSNNRSNTPASNSQIEEMSLKRALQQTESRFGVSIAYKSELIKSKKVRIDLAICQTPEDALHKALGQFDLAFEKVREHFYLITEKKRTEAAPAHLLNGVQRILRGKVIDKSGNGLVGVTLKIKGTTTGTVSAGDGTFSLSIAGTGNEILEASYIGYETQEIPVGNQQLINITLLEGNSVLNEVIVTGYTTQRRKDLTGAISVVRLDDMTKQPSGLVVNQLQGQASGVTIIGSGQPGEEPLVHIRGVNTFGTNTPLYVVDGVPTQSINDLNPNDIASMQVLKDAGAASIYGSRASNGVIIITTKKGSGKVTVQYDAYYGRQYPKGGNVWNTLNPQEMANLKWLTLRNSNEELADTLYGRGAQPVLPDYLNPVGLKEGDPRTNPDLYYINPDYTSADDYNNFYRITKANKAGTDWYHEIFRPAPITSHNISVSGGGDKGNYLFSFNYFNQQGTLMNTYLKRYTIRSNSQFNISKGIRIGQNLSVSVTDNPTISPLSADNAIGMAFREQPIIPVHDIKGNFAGTSTIGLGDGANPVATQYRTRNDRGQANRVLGNVYADVDFLDYFTLHSSFGGEVYSNWNHTFTYPQYENKENSSVNSYNETNSNGYNWTWTNTLTFHKIFANTHDLKVLVGTEAYDEQTRTQGGTTLDYFSFDPIFVDNGTGSGGQTITASRTSEGLASLIGRMDYAFREKYLLSATIRRDGSSKFGPNSRYGWFPAFSAAWRVSQEPFMKNVSWISDLKLRGGWGIMGNQLNLSAGNAFSLFGGNKNTSFYDLRGTNNSILQGFQQFQIANPDARWEKDINANIGIDASLFGGKLEIAADYYEKNITDLLYNPELPGSYGTAPPPFVNVANMKNNGIDITVGSHANITRDLKLDATLTFTTYKNRIVKLADGVDYFEEDGRRLEGSKIIRNAAGHPVSSFYGYQVIGFWNDEAEIEAANKEAQEATKNPDAEYQTEAGIGRFRYADINHDGQINGDDRTFLGNPNPKISYGINLGLTYKNFDFSIFLYGVHGNQIWNNIRWWMDFPGPFEGAKSKTALYDSWLPDRKNARAPIQESASTFSTNNVPNSYFVENGAYLRAKNIQLGYTFPKDMLSRIRVERLRIYVQAANLFTITKYTGMDPEIGGGSVTDYGIDDGAYPSQRQFLAGINLSF